MTTPRAIVPQTVVNGKLIRAEENLLVTKTKQNNLPAIRAASQVTKTNPNDRSLLPETYFSKPQEIIYREIPRKSAEDDDDFTPFLTIMMMMFMMTILQSFLASQSESTALAQAFSPFVYQGRTDSRIVNATPVLQWFDLIHSHPYRPWTSVIIENDGPNIAEVGLNSAGELFRVFPGIPKTIERTTSIDKIAVVFYITEPGESAVLHFIGEY